MAMLDKCKSALQIADDTSAYDDEINDLIAAARLDLSIAGVVDPVSHTTGNEDENPLIERAIITYCRFSFGSPADYDKLKSAYDEQKSQMKSATGYTDWGTTE